MANRARKRKVCGVEATRGDGMIWTWSVGNRTYRWCRLFHVEEFMPDGGIVRVCFVKQIDAAIAFTVGYSHGQYSVIGQSAYETITNAQEIMASRN